MGWADPISERRPAMTMTQRFLAMLTAEAAGDEATSESLFTELDEAGRVGFAAFLLGQLYGRYEDDAAALGITLPELLQHLALAMERHS